DQAEHRAHGQPRGAELATRSAPHPRPEQPRTSPNSPTWTTSRNNAMHKQPFSFSSEDATVVGDLYLPAGPARGISVVTGPLTSVKEQAAGSYAAALAERGYAALAFDYRHFGESGGEPRQLEDPEENITDIRNAVTALANVPALADPPALGGGVCFGAGPMAVAVSRDARFRGFAGVAGVYTDL